jgi:hypothetical protein
MTYGAVRLPAGGRVLDALKLLLVLKWELLLPAPVYAGSESAA